MKMNIPYEKEIVFNTKIADITSISLEYEANVLDEDIEGEFIISGDYKIHELSVNKEPFKYRIPFNVSLTDDIIRDSIKYDINNFTYEVIDDDTLKVNIEFGIDYEVVKDKIAKEENKEIEVKEAVTFNKDYEDNKDTKERETKATIELNNLLDDIELNNEISDNKLKDNTNIKDNAVADNNIEVKAKNTTENLTTNDNKEVVLNNVNNALNTYVTYHIHVLSDGEDINTIINKYSLENNQKLLDKVVPVLIQGISEKGTDKVYGYTDTMKLVNVTGPKSLIGKIVNVHITDAKSFSLDGIVEN